MSDRELINFSNLNEKEVESLYEFFFGKILVKSKKIDYKESLTHFIQKPNFLSILQSKLPELDFNVLKTISICDYLPYQFIVEKLSIILDKQPSFIEKSLKNLIEKNIIFLRDNQTLIIPDYNIVQKRKIEYNVLQEDINFNSKIYYDLINFLNYLLSKNITLSLNGFIYKKDLSFLEDIFKDYSTLQKDDFYFISYFFSLIFLDMNQKLHLKNINNFFSMNKKERILFFIKICFPQFYNIYKYFIDKNKNVVISLNDFKELWEKTFLSIEYKTTPIKTSFEKIVNFLNKLDVINIDGNFVKIKLIDDKNENKTDIKSFSGFVFYINSMCDDSDFYIPAVFGNMLKYNIYIEYELNEESVKKAIVAGMTLQDIMDYFNRHNIVLSKNVETTLKQWADKYGAYYYAEGTIFICNTPEKGKLISELIDSGFATAYEIKKNEIFFIPEEEKSRFFSFLEKSGINYYSYKPTKNNIDYNEIKDDNIESFLKN
ncbi:MAG TPA: hypothetical protein PLE45_12385 [Spirochaetota bacterium]|nr:hypothetical protein [Spirochaetota bacterium]HOL58074.1 hypothetical protein [Spirochaetota bacterium]HPP05554.1 hypothetical protein [Spirochaetota bacterium]